MKLKLIIYILLNIAVIIFLSSCSEDPVKPPPEEKHIQVIDSNIFDWEFEMLPGYVIVGISVVDSNKIFLAGNPNTLYYNGTSFTIICQNSSDFSAECVTALDENNVYIGGNDNIFPVSSSKLKKWNGSSIEEIPFPLDSSHGIAYIYIEGINSIWLATNSNKVYHYDGINITTYFIPIPSIYNPSVFKENNGNLFLFGLHPLSGGNDIHSTFKFENNTWQPVTQDTVNVTTELGIRVLQCGNDILRNGRNKIFYFTGISWGNLIETPDIEQQYSISGPSINNFMIFGYHRIFGPKPIYYDGEKLLVQTDFEEPPPIQSIKNVLVYKNGRYYGHFAGDPYNNALIKGKFKNNP